MLLTIWYKYGEEREPILAKKLHDPMMNVRHTVGNNSPVKVYTMEKAVDTNSFPSMANITVTQPRAVK